MAGLPQLAVATYEEVLRRFSSHFFLAENSELYRRVSGEDLIDEDLDLDLMGEVPEERDTKDSKDAKDD